MTARRIVECQSCSSRDLEEVFNAGFLPQVNVMTKVGEPLLPSEFYPTELLLCRNCRLVQLGIEIDRDVVFPADYAYTSGTTQALRDNFANLCRQVQKFGCGKSGDLVVDIGSNDGTLLQEFKKAGFNVLGIEPTDAADVASAKGIPTVKKFFPIETYSFTTEKYGFECPLTQKAKVITACNVLAHMPNVHACLDQIVEMLADDGTFVSESHYLPSLLRDVQYDTVYHEHLRYYSLESLAKLLDKHKLGIIKAECIPTHGGSIRVYAKKNVNRPIPTSILKPMPEEFATFRCRVAASKTGLYRLLDDALKAGPVWGVGAPSRATTLINYLGLDETILERVCEVAGSRKVGRYVPGTKIPITLENDLFVEEPPHVLLLSWHIAGELIPKLRARGFKGRFILPLPTPEIVCPDA